MVEVVWMVVIVEDGMDGKEELVGHFGMGELFDVVVLVVLENANVMGVFAFHFEMEKNGHRFLHLKQNIN